MNDFTENRNTKTPADVVVVSRSRLKLFMSVVAGVAFIGLMLGGASLYFSYHKASADAQRSSATTESERDALVREVGALIALPDSVPTIATVNDPAILADQPFFEHAQKGDKVLIYAKEGKTILYDPSAKKIVEVGVIQKS